MRGEGRFLGVSRVAYGRPDASYAILDGRFFHSDATKPTSSALAGLLDLELPIERFRSWQAILAVSNFLEMLHVRSPAIACKP